MYYAEKLLESMSATELRLMLTSIIENDYYTKDFYHSKLTDDFLYMLELYNLVFVTSAESRVMLTPLGIKTLIYLNQTLI
jgi:hypothetical protein